MAIAKLYDLCWMGKSETMDEYEVQKKSQKKRLDIVRIELTTGMWWGER